MTDKDALNSQSRQKEKTNKLSLMHLTGIKDDHIHYLTPTLGIHQEMLDAWLMMQKSAKEAGITLCIASGYRNAERQLQIWNAKFSGSSPIKNNRGETLDINRLTDKEKILAILHFSALPCASRHHWGTDIDVYAKNHLPEGNSLQLEPWEYSATGYFYELSKWLEKHSKEYGFYFPYDVYRNGIAAEPWHLSYAPLSSKFQQDLKLSALREAIEKLNIKGKKTILSLLPTIYSQFITNVNPENILKE